MLLATNILGLLFALWVIGGMKKQNKEIKKLKDVIGQHSIEKLKAGLANEVEELKEILLSLSKPKTKTGRVSGKKK